MYVCIYIYLGIYICIISAESAELNGSSLGNHQCDSPSALTSGSVVCGNLIMALRKRRKRTNAWTEDSSKTQQVNKIKSNNKNLSF